MRRLQFEIAWRLGIPHPDLLLSLLDSAQLSEVYAYNRVERSPVKHADDAELRSQQLIYMFERASASNDAKFARGK